MWKEFRFKSYCCYLMYNFFFLLIFISTGLNYILYIFLYIFLKNVSSYFVLILVELDVILLLFFLFLFIFLLPGTWIISTSCTISECTYSVSSMFWDLCFFYFILFGTVFLLLYKDWESDLMSQVRKAAKIYTLKTITRFILRGNIY